MYITIDIGGTNTRIAGTLDLENPTFTSEPIRRRNSTNYETELAHIVESSRQISGEEPIKAIGIGIAGTLSEDKRTVSAKNLGHWSGKPFMDDLERKLGCPVFAENDAVAAALGEATYGQIKDDFAYIIWGTGIGGAVVKLAEGEPPSASQFGWRKYFSQWEYDCGGREIEKAHGKSPEKLSDQEWQRIFAKFETHTRSFIETVQPKAIIFGGGLSLKHHRELEGLTKKLGLPCYVSQFDDDIGLFGGLALIKK